MRTGTDEERAELQWNAIVNEWLEGGTIAEIAHSTGLSKSRVSSILEDAGVRNMRPDAKYSKREKQRGKLLEWIRENPGRQIKEAAEAVGIPQRLAVVYLTGTEERELVIERRAKKREYSEQELRDSLRRVWKLLTPAERELGLSRNRYTELAGEKDPSQSLYDRRYRSWSDACEAAGIAAGATYRRVYTQKYSDDDILDAIDEYIGETGRTSFNGYADWAMESATAPAGATVILRFGSWGAARAALLDREHGD